MPEKDLDRLGAAAAGAIAASDDRIDIDVGGAVETSSSSDDDCEFVDAMYDCLELQSHPQLQPPRLLRLQSNYGILEDCGRWLMAIPRDDVVALQQTPEYGEFLSAFDRLGEVRYASFLVIYISFRSRRGYSPFFVHRYRLDGAYPLAYLLADLYI
jgi:hypothetical protein